MSENYSTPQTTALNLTGANTVTESDITTDTGRTFSVYGAYNQNRPGVWNESGMNELMFGDFAYGEFRSAQFEEELVEQDLAFAGDGTEATRGTWNEQTQQRTLEGRADFTVNANLGHSVYYGLGGNARLGMIPRFNIRLDVDQDDYLISERVDVNRNDNDAHGAFDSAADRVITTTTEYTNTDNGIAAAQDVLKVIHMFQLAGAIEFPPGEWPIQIVLGSHPRLEVEDERTTTLAAESTTTTEIVDGTGADQRTTVVQTEATGETSVWSHSFSVEADHNIGLGIDVSETVRVDVQLDLSSEMSTLDFKDMVAQVIVKLP